MSNTLNALAERPPHVPIELVVDLDFHNPPRVNGDVNLGWRKLQEAAPPICWTPYNGGHWMLLRGDDIEFMQKNHNPFSTRSIVIPAGSTPNRMLPLEADPPEHSYFRAIINQFFTPSATRELAEEARRVAVTLIDGFKHRGHCEFRSEFALKLPIVVFMKLVRQPLEDADVLLPLADKSTRPKSPQDMIDAFTGVTAYIEKIVADRRANPQDDILSSVVKAEIRGEPIKHEDIVSMMIVLLFGGLDTIAATLGFAAEYLARHPAKRQQLIDRPELIPNAVDELLRLFGPSSTARTLTRDFEYKGIQFKEGEQILVRPGLHSIDESKFPNALDADWERPKLERSYAIFGNGPHRCPGATLARREVQIYLEEWLARIPNFETDPDDPPVIGTGIVYSVLQLQLLWNPASVR